MVYGVLKLINFAHGDVMMVGVYLGYATALQLGHEQRRRSLWGVLADLPRRDGRLRAARLPHRAVRLPAAAREAAAHLADHRDRHLLRARRTASSWTSVRCPGAAPRAFPEIISPTEWLIIGDRDVVIWNWQVISLADRRRA